MQREFLPGPPVGFRKAIPVNVKLDAVIRQDGRCKACGERLGQLGSTEFDHVPALQLRRWDVEAQDTVPPANDPDSIHAKHADCHDVKTFGRPAKGASKVGTDIHEIARVKRLTRKEEDFRRRVLAKEDGAPPPAPAKRKYQWPKRSLRSEKSLARDQARITDRG